MTFDETLKAICEEARSLGLVAEIEYPGFVVITDSLGRCLLVGQPDGADEGWRADVWVDADAHEAGEEPDEVDQLADPSVPLMVNHALAIAERVSLSSRPCAECQRSNGPHFSGPCPHGGGL